MRSDQYLSLNSSSEHQRSDRRSASSSNGANRSDDDFRAGSNAVGRSNESNDSNRTDGGTGSFHGRKRASPLPTSAQPSAAPPAKKSRSLGSVAKATSCENCRRRKLKCDRNFPCSGCVLRNETHLCKWESGSRPTALQNQVPVPTAALDKLERIEQLAFALAEQHGINDSPPPSESSESQVQPPPPPQPHPLPDSHPGSPAQHDQTGEHVPYSSVPPHMHHSAHSPGVGMRARTRSASGAIPLVPPDKEDMPFTIPFSIRDDWKSNQRANRQLCLRELIEVLPPQPLLNDMTQAFFKDVLLFSYIIDKRTFFTRLEELEAYRARPENDKITISDQEARKFLELSALVWSVCSIALIETGQQAYEGLLDLYEEPVPTFMDAAMQALDSCEGLQIPTIETVRVQVLIARLTHMTRGDSWGSVSYLLAIGNAFAVHLHKEPPPNLSEEDFFDRIRLFTFIMFIDAFGTGGPHSRRGCLIPDNGPYSTPSFLYSDASWTMARDDGPWPRDLKLTFEMSRIMSKSTGRQYLSEDESYQLTTKLQAQLDTLVGQISPNLLQPSANLWKSNRGMTLPTAIQLALYHLALALHGRHYVAGWLNERYVGSRNVCVDAALAIVRIFLSFCALFLPPDYIEHREKGRDLEPAVKALASRGCFLGREAAICGLLLQHHLYLMFKHPERVGPHPPGIDREEVLKMLKHLKTTLELVGPLMMINPDHISELLDQSRTTPSDAWCSSPIVDCAEPGAANRRCASSMSSSTALSQLDQDVGKSQPLLASLSASTRLGVGSRPSSPLARNHLAGPTWHSPSPQEGQDTQPTQHTQSMQSTQGMQEMHGAQEAQEAIPSLEHDASLVAGSSWFQQAFVDFESLVSSLLTSGSDWSLLPAHSASPTPRTLGAVSDLHGHIPDHLHSQTSEGNSMSSALHDAPPVVSALGPHLVGPSTVGHSPASPHAGSSMGPSGQITALPTRGSGSAGPSPVDGSRLTSSPVVP